MKFRFEMFYRTSLVTLFLIAFWAVWAGAQTNQHPAGANTVIAAAASTTANNVPTTGNTTNGKAGEDPD